MEGPRLSVRGIVLRDGRLLMVNAWPDGRSDLICAPGGGVDRGQSLPDNLVREIHEETGLTVQVGPVVLVNEFHDPAGTFHQVDVFFRCRLVSGDPDGEWADAGGVVTRTFWLTRDELAPPPVQAGIAAGRGLGRWRRSCLRCLGTHCQIGNGQGRVRNLTCRHGTP